MSVLVADRYPNYSICGLPYFLSDDVPDWCRLAHRSLDELGHAGIEVLLEHRAGRLDATARIVTVHSPARGEHAQRYDAVVIATGAEPV